MFRLLLLSLALIVYGSLYPWHFEFTRPLSLYLASWPSLFDRFAVRDAAINLCLYAPLGFFAGLFLSHRLSRAWTILAAVLCGAALSLAMEFLQVFIPGRTSSLFDVVVNTVGTIVGAAAASAFGDRWVAVVKRRVHHSAAGAGILLACWAGYQLYPFFPVVSQTRLHAAIDLLVRSHTATGVEIVLFAAEWFAAALVLDALLGPLPPLWLAAAMVALPLRVFIPSRTISAGELLGAALAWAAWLAIPRRFRLRAGMWALLAALLLGELAPFHFSRNAAAFSWIPFAAAFEVERWHALVILLGKAFAYGAAVWLLARSGRGYLRAGALLAAALFVLELAQRSIPGRTPDITDPVLALLMAFSLRAAHDLAARRGVA